MKLVFLDTQTGEIVEETVNCTAFDLEYGHLSGDAGRSVYFKAKAHGYNRFLIISPYKITDEYGQTLTTDYVNRFYPDGLVNYWMKNVKTERKTNDTLHG